MAAIIEFQDIAKKYGEKTIMEHFNLVTPYQPGCGRVPPQERR